VQIVKSIRAVVCRLVHVDLIKAKSISSIDLQCAYRRDETSLLYAALLGMIRDFSVHGRTTS
jgi:hypothetical protein